LNTGHLTSDAISQTRYDLTTPQDLTACLDNLTERLNTAPTA
jgi:hypothetical protein